MAQFESQRSCDRAPHDGATKLILTSYSDRSVPQCGEEMQPKAQPLSRKEQVLQTRQKTCAERSREVIWRFQERNRGTFRPSHVFS